MKGSLYTVSYAASLGIVCAGLLTGVGGFTRPYRLANEQAEKVRNILAVLEIPHDENAGAKELLDLFKKTVKKGPHEDLAFYVYIKEGVLMTVAFAFEGQGLWGPIEGFLALEPGLATVRGVTFHKQEETPGLGGEIGAEWFREQFRGKSIGEDGAPGIRIKKGGGASGPSEVDAITGATMTCVKVEKMLSLLMARILREREALMPVLEGLIRERGAHAR